MTASAVSVERRRHPRPDRLFAGYVAGSAAVRIDPATEILGLRVKTLVSGATLLVAIAVIVYRQRRERSSVGVLAELPRS